ncbi:MAG: glycosyltransferase family 2 protein [Candidatus Nanopelagicales bacterium]
MNGASDVAGDSLTFDDVLVVIPAWNEAPVIEQVVKSVLIEFPHVLVIDDGSSDGTAELAAAAGARTAVHALNLGQGGALATGLDVARQLPWVRWVVTFDADGQHLAGDAARMVDIARRDNLDVVLGTRFSGGTTNAGRWRRMTLRAATAYTRWSTGLKVTDTHNGLRVLSREFAARLHLRERGMGHASEILDQIAEQSAQWVEVPVDITYTQYSVAKGQPISNAVTILFDRLMR